MNYLINTKSIVKALVAASFMALGFSASFAQAMEVDTAKSSFKWTGTKKIGKFHTGNIKLKSAKLDLEGKAVKGGEFVMDMSSITNEDLEGEWKQKFLGHVKSGDFFDIEKHPTAKLVINKITGDKAEGELTIKDKTNPVTIPFAKKGNHYEGTLTFDRTKFGIVYNSANFFKDLVADKVINNEVKLDFKVVVQ